jgi:diguanylate cyclase (GGDEF)-like protein
MKAWTPLLVPIAFIVILLVLFTCFPTASGLSDHAPFRAMPYLLTIFAAMLGGVFLQSRVSFICLLLGVATYVLDWSLFTEVDRASAHTTVFLVSVYFPSLAVLFYHLHERGIFTVHGYVRLAILLSTMIVVVVVPRITSIADMVYRTELILFRPVSEHLSVPWIGIAVLGACCPFFVIRNRHESPLLGPTIGLATLLVFLGLNAESDLWKVGQAREILLLSMSASAVTLAWVVLESSWRNAHIDELTELPGRRSLKHHLARLSSSYCIAMLDIDHFKRINDKYGHDVGDQMLRFVASAIKKDSTGKAYRYGGEEFAIICETQDYDAVIAGLDALRERIGAGKFVLRGKNRPRRKPDSTNRRSDEKGVSATVSIGIARPNKRYTSPSAVIEAADKALYRAKKDGRNQVKATR